MNHSLTLKPKFINSGNITINEKIKILLSNICDQVDTLVKTDGSFNTEEVLKLLNKLKLTNQYCEIDCMEVENSAIELGDEKIISTLKDVKDFFGENFVLNRKLNGQAGLEECIMILNENYPNGVKLMQMTLCTILSKCKNFKDCEIVIKNYGTDIELDIETINLLLSKCTNIEECDYIMDNYGKSVILDIHTLNTLLAKCKSVFEYKKIVTQYNSQGIELNGLSHAIKLKLLFIEKNKADWKIKEEITNTLVTLNTCELSNKTKGSIKANILYNPCKYKNYIISVIRDHKLSNLYYIIENHKN